MHFDSTCICLPLIMHSIMSGQLFWLFFFILEIEYLFSPQAQRARGRLIQEVRKSFTVDAFIGNATDWEKVCVGNLVGMPVMIVPVGFAPLENPPSSGTRRRRAITTGIYAPPQHDHIVSFMSLVCTWVYVGKILVGEESQWERA